MRRRRTEGFALVLTLTLLALAVLIAVAIATLVRVNARIATTATFQTQARQNALVGMGLALERLQRLAGPDDRVTAMAGMVGVPPQDPRRQWCGVWRAGAAGPEGWLVSGAEKSAMPQVRGERIEIVGTGSVGNPTDRTDQERVEVGAIEMPGVGAGVNGRCAFWVGDEGAKVSAVIRAGEEQAAGIGGAGLRPNLRRLAGAGFAPQSLGAANVVSLEQLKQAGAGSLTAAFHAMAQGSVALPSTAAWGVPTTDGYVVGAFNVNTTSEAAWRAWLEFPDHTNSVFGLTANRSLSAARNMRDLWAQRGRPFASVAELEASGLVQEAFERASPKITSVTAEDFLAELRPILAVRSDTFRVRGFGEAGVAADGTRAVAYCEAIVQRTGEMLDTTLGRRFVVVYFRWLLPEDV